MNFVFHIHCCKVIINKGELTLNPKLYYEKDKQRGITLYSKFYYACQNERGCKIITRKMSAKQQEIKE
jgi:hypothetical protein